MSRLPLAAAVSATLTAMSAAVLGTPRDGKPTNTLSVNDDDSLPASVVIPASDDVIGNCELTTPDNITSCTSNQPVTQHDIHYVLHPYTGRWTHTSTSAQSNLTKGRIATAHGWYSLYFARGCPFLPQNCSFSWGNLDHHLIHGSLGPPQSTTQITSRLVQPFSQGPLLWQQTHKQNRPCYSICNNRPHPRTQYCNAAQ